MPFDAIAYRSRARESAIGQRALAFRGPDKEFPGRLVIWEIVCRHPVAIVFRFPLRPNDVASWPEVSALGAVRAIVLDRDRRLCRGAQRCAEVHDQRVTIVVVFEGSGT
jgi:hypothetical protein